MTKLFRRLSWIKASAIALIAVLPGFSLADDIDLFATNVDTTAEVSNVVIVLDNTANWNQPFDFEKSSLQTVFAGLDGRYNVGLMMFTETGGGNTGNDGAYVRYHIRNMTGTGKSNLTSLINGLDVIADKSNSGKAGLTMHEVYQYFTGGAVFAGGSSKVKSDLAAGSTTYNSPISSGCQKNFLIYISNGPVQDNTSDTTSATTKLTAAGGSATTIAVTPNGSQDNIADEWARFMFGTDMKATIAGPPEQFAGKQCVTTFTIDVNPGASGQGPGWSALMQSMARVGRGQYFIATDTATFTAALQKIFNQIQAVNSVFASATLPVSVSVRGTFLNQVYMGVFRPDAYRSPRWLGNLKQYKIGLDGANNPILVDSVGSPIENTTTGFVVPDAKSYWTSASTFWTFAPQGAGAGSDSPDGEFVEKGAAAQRLRSVYATSQDARKLYTCSTSACPAETLSAEFNTANTGITDASLGLGTTASVSSLSRVGGTVTATTSAAHGFTDGQSIKISGASPTNYNGTFAISVLGSTTFSYFITENPATPASGAPSVSVQISPKPVTSITRSGTTATVTLPGHGYLPNDVVTMVGAAESEYNGAFTITVVDANTFTYTVPTGPTTTITLSSATAKVGGTGPSISAMTRNSAANPLRVTVSLGSNPPTSFQVGANVVIAGATPAAYSGTFAIAALGNSCPNATNPAGRVICYDIAITPTTPATGSITADTDALMALPILSIIRSGTTATATTSSDHGLIGTAIVSILGANETEYNGSKTVIVTDTTHFTYTVTVGPTTPATGTISAASSGVDRTTLINWVRGADNYEDENGNGSTSTSTDVRASIHGDVLHSRPAVINYFTSGADDVVVFYGSNDGIFHAVQGGQAVTEGNELWGFIAPGAYPKFNRLITQSPAIGSVAPFAPRPFFFDGGIGVYQEGANPPTKVNVFVSQRRGGRRIYAFDVTTKATPRLLWRKGCAETTGNGTASGSGGCDTDYGYLGQTWSEPKAGKVAATANPVVMFGGGYDNFAEDAEPATTATMGNRIFIVDATDGSVLKQFGASDVSDNSDQAITNSVAADLYLIDGNGDSNIDRVYATDTGGNVWRMDIGDASVANWKIWKLASISGTLPDGTASTAEANKRKFLFGVSVSRVVDDPINPYDAVLVGSGDREHPLDTATAYNTNNRFYMFKDKKTGLSGSAQATVTEANLADLTTVLDPAAAKTLLSASGNRGWLIQLIGRGEKTVSGATTAAGTTFFNTHHPSQIDEGTCSNLGEAHLYQVGFKDATATLGDRYEVHPGGGFPPTPIYVVVKVTDAADPTKDKTVEGVIVGTNVRPPGTTRFDARYRTYWYEIKDD